MDRSLEEMLYTKKPVTISAVQYISDEASYNAIIGMGCPRLERDTYFSIPTLEGEMKVSHGDWVIKGIKGEFYPCKPDIFEATYEPAGLSPVQGEEELFPEFWSGFGKRMVEAGDPVEVIAQTAWHAAKAGK